MDDDIQSLDGYNVSMRKTRQGSECSMSSQRLEEIVGALMKPIKDMKQNFDMDLNSLLEEYLTEAGLRQLNGRDCADDSLPNFAEVALLLQQSANIYSKKVDYLWLKVVEIVQSFGVSESDQNRQNDSENVEATNDTVRSKRKTKSKNFDITNFEPIELEEATNINLKENSDPKPLPVLPKTFIQFEPRVISNNDVHIKDYKGDIIGVGTDFRCNWNTDHNGELRDDLDFCAEKAPLDICAANVIPSSFASPTDSGHCSDYTPEGHTSSTPVNGFSDFDISAHENNLDLMSPNSERDYPDMTSILDPPPPETPAVETPTVTLESEKPQNKKRKISDGTTPIKPKSSKYDMGNPIVGTVSKMKIQSCCFELPKDMIEKIIKKRKNKLKKLRKILGKVEIAERHLDSQFVLDCFPMLSNSKSAVRWHRQQIYKGLTILATDWEKDFYGFDLDNYDQKDESDYDVTGFRGFSQEELDRCHKRYSRQKVLYSSAVAKCLEPSLDRLTEDGPPDSDDHNYDENTPVEADPEVPLVNRLNAEATLEKNNLICSKEQMEIAQRVEEWHNSIRSNLQKAERRKMLDLWSYSSRVLTSFPSGEETGPVISFSQVMKKKPPEDKARYFLATLMLANSANVEIIPTDPVECRDFQLRLISTERRVNEEDSFF